jgi:sugar phosphate isomerase/epimerase
MKRVVSTHVTINHRLTVSWLNKAQQSGISAVELFLARQHIDYRNKAQIVELGHWFRDADMTCHSVHLPMYNDEYGGRSGPDAVISITEPVKGKRIGMTDEIKRALEVAEVIPFQYAVQHLGVPNEEFDERKLDAAFTCLEELTLFARHRGVEILLENIPNQLSSGERLQFFNTFTHLNMNYVFDSGHANLMEGVDAAFDAMAPRIKSTHIHDNDGQADKHLFPFVSDGGTIDWASLMTRLRSRGDQFPLLLELKEQPDIEDPFDAINQVFYRLENLRESEG